MVGDIVGGRELRGEVAVRQVARCGQGAHGERIQEEMADSNRVRDGMVLHVRGDGWWWCISTGAQGPQPCHRRGNELASINKRTTPHHDVGLALRPTRSRRAPKLKPPQNQIE